MPAARRREAANLGYSANENGRHVLEVELSELLEQPYARAVEQEAVGGRALAKPMAAAGRD